MKRWSHIVTGVILLLSVHGSAFCQLLFKPGMEPENYARTGYHKYGRSVINRQANPKYDSFGNYIMDGVRVFNWNEQKINSRHTKAGEKYSTINKTNEIDEGEYFREYLNNLVVVHETQKSFSTRFIVGNEIRVKFSPLTVDMAALNGVRWDFDVKQNYFTFISSRADLPLWFSRDYVNDDLRHRLLPVYMTGAHYERRVGIFNVAANYVNSYRSDSSQSRQKNSITGTIPWNPNDVEMLVVKLEDGSRFDGSGPRLYELIPVVNGEKRPDLLVGITKGSWERDFSDVRALQDNPAKDLYENRYFLDPRRIPQYIKFDNAESKKLPSNFLMRRDTTAASWNQNATNIVDMYRESLVTDGNEKYLETNGSEYLQFWFEMPKTNSQGQPIEVSDVEFRALVGNDYKFSISEIYHDEHNTNTQKNATYFYVVREAPGNIKDMSNLGWVSFHHGQETANMLMGFRIDADVKDFEFVAEYNKNLKFRQFMHNDAKKRHQDSDAYYINLRKTFGKFQIGGEYFNIDPQYSTTFENTDPSYFAMKSIPLHSWTPYFNDDVSLQGGHETPSGSSDSAGFMANTMMITTVDDNDDKDRYPDFHIFSDVRDRNGIFPGLDRNGNNRPDTNENDNLMPDYAEPFLLYNVDPDEYDFGDDFNNNGVIDEREDDDQPDYPYDRDTRGFHIFSSFGEDLGLKYTLGYINYKEIWGGGKTDVKYGRIEYRKFIPFFAELNFASNLKKVKDSVMNDVFRHNRLLSTTLIDSFSYVDNIFRTREGLQHEPFYDRLKYRDSYVTSSYFNAKLFRIPNLNIELKLKYDLNHQNEASYQKKNDIIERTQIIRADYRFYFKDLLLMPQVKYMSRKYTNHDGYELPFHEESFYPIFRAEYPLTFKTTLKAGMQGFPGLNAKVRNLVNNQLDYDERHYVIMLTNSSLYQGYDFSLNFGYQVNWQELHGIMRKPYSRTDKLLFIRLVVGMEPIS